MQLLRRQIRCAIVAIAGLASLLFAGFQLVYQPPTADPRELSFIAMLALATAGLALFIRKLLDARGRFSMRLILITVVLAASWSLVLRWLFLLSS